MKTQTTPLVALIGAMDQEIDLLKQSMDAVEKISMAGFDFYTGVLHSVNIVLLKSDIGKVNAAIGTSILLQQFKPDYVLNTGSAGGTDQALTPGDVVIGVEMLQHDVDVTAFEYVPGQIPGMPARFAADAALIECAEKVLLHWPDQKANIVKGAIASGDRFMHNPTEVQAMMRQFNDVKAVEMEGAAIAQTCFRFNTPFLVIRALSDIAGQSSDVTFYEFIEIASKHSATMVAAIVKELAKS